MRIVSAGPSVSAVTPQVASYDPPPSEARGPALVTVEQPRQSERISQLARHPLAPFVAHLIATRMQAPQTRERRRAEPDEAIAVYRFMTKPVTMRRVFGTQA